MATGAGVYTKRAELQPPVEADPDSLGEPIVSYAAGDVRWVAFDALAGRELWSAQQVHPSITHLLKMRFYRGLTPRWRIVFQARVFNILWIRDVKERNLEHWIYCNEAPDLALPLLDFSVPASSQYLLLI